ASHTFTVPSPSPDATASPAGPKLTLQIGSVWPPQSARSLPLLASHTFTAPPSSPDATASPVGLKLTLRTVLSCPAQPAPTNLKNLARPLNVPGLPPPGLELTLRTVSVSPPQSA